MASRPRPSSREALLLAGYEALLELCPVDLVAALRTREIARRAGVSAPTFFHHFRSVEQYADALVEFVFSPDRTRLEGVVTASLIEAQRQRLPADQAIWYHTNDLLQLAAQPDFRLRLGLWALGGSRVDEAYGRSLEAIDAQLLPQAQALHDVWGREVRPPLDLRSYLAVQVAILTGSAMRHLAEPDVLTPDRYARAAAALSMVMLRPRGDRRTMDDRLSEMNYYPGGTPRPVAGSRRDRTRGRIVDAAAETFGEYGYDAASINHIARVARVHVATVYDHFESKRHLALVLFLLEAQGHLATSGRAGATWLDRLGDHLRKIATLAGMTPDLARQYVSATVCGDQPADLDDVLLGSTVDIILEGSAPQDDASRSEAGRLAEHLLVGTIGAILRHPGHGPDRAAADGLRYLGS